MRASFKPDYRNSLRADATLTYVNTSFTTTGLATILAGTTGKYTRIWAMKIQMYVTTVLAGATALDPLYILDNVIGTPIAGLRFENSNTATRAAQGGYIVAANDAVTVHYGWANEDYGTAGLRLSAKANAIKAGTPATITSGVIAVRGWVLTTTES